MVHCGANMSELYRVFVLHRQLHVCNVYMHNGENLMFKDLKKH